MPPGDPPDDENHDWFDGDPTHVDQNLVETNPHRSLDYLAGREDGFSKGVARVIEVLAIELRRAGLTDAESRPVCLRVRVRALDEG